jgi:hypothetical protein
MPRRIASQATFNNWWSRDPRGGGGGGGATLREAAAAFDGFSKRGGLSKLKGL